MVLAGAVGGCDSSKTASSGPPQNILRFESGVGVFESPFGAGLTASFAPMVTLYDFAISASNGNGHWAATMSLSRDAVATGRVEVPIASLSDGTAARVETLGAVAETGTFTATFGSGTLTGSVSTSPDIHSGTFSGALMVTCNVPSGALAGQPTPGGTSGGTLVEDTHLETEQCAFLRPWRAK
jgi:hypothetical protein